MWMQSDQDEYMANRWSGEQSTSMTAQLQRRRMLGGSWSELEVEKEEARGKRVEGGGRRERREGRGKREGGRGEGGQTPRLVPEPS